MKKMSQQRLRQQLNEIIFGTETPAGRGFDIALIYAILISVFIVIIDSVEHISSEYKGLLFFCEWLFTILFSIEYAVRLYCSQHPFRYARSFYGIVDLLSILPSYIAFFLPQAQFFIIIRLFRVLRIFRVLKLFRYLGEANMLMRSILLARRKIFVFLMSVVVLVSIFGSLMYVIEGPEHGFTSIPTSIYWAIVTITTVGYGDITPQTVLGQSLASIIMVTGYAIIAVPTGIITAELAVEIGRDKGEHSCRNCKKTGHDSDAVHCKYCGAKMEIPV
ncbi:ion transporter [Spartinivicinus poritis]|uniref:Ion transporter n=1 Tax=Spartinivicinus poritis TaxID=2994640 RepID=A0ABT5UBY1_9GAMM|nr:ion transporter [Spartinivicinus sp. A2-2]MDE1463695.1 ion transporter [Spartinivicinus sp. A2-2]